MNHHQTTLRIQGLTKSDDRFFELLEMCFEMCAVEDRMKQELISQFLHSRAVPPSRPLSCNDLPQKAYWFAYQAASLQNMPMSQPIYDRREEVEISKRTQMCLYQFGEHVPTELVNYDNLGRNMSRQTVLQAAESMYQIAKSIVLDPQVYMQISKNETLVKAAFCMISYLIVLGERAEEAQLFISAIKVFLNKNIGVLNHTCNETDPWRRQATERQKMTLERMFRMVSGSELTLLVNSIITGTSSGYPIFTEKSFKKYLKRAAKEFRVEYGDPVTKQSINRHGEVYAKLATMVKGISRSPLALSQFLSSCRAFKRMDSFIPVWKLLVTCKQVFAMEVVLAARDPPDPAVYQMKLSLAEEVTNLMLDNLALAVHGGARFLVLLHFTKTVHLEKARSLNHGVNVAPVDVYQCLHMIESSILICKCLIDRYQIKSLQQMLKELEDQQRISTEHLSRLEMQVYTSTFDSLQKMDEDLFQALMDLQ